MFSKTPTNDDIKAQRELISRLSEEHGIDENVVQFELLGFAMSIMAGIGQGATPESVEQVINLLKQKDEAFERSCKTTVEVLMKYNS